MASNTIWQDIRQTLSRSNTVVQQLIIVNIIVFLLINVPRLFFWLAGYPLDPYYYSDYLGVPSDLNQLLHKPWTLFTYMFTHGEVMHILFNMLVLYWFGRILTEFLGNRKILPLYLLGGLSGAVLFIACYQLFPVFHAAVPEARAWGASASVMAIMVAAATLVPDYTMFLVLIGPVKIKWIAIFTIALDVLSIPSSNAGGHIAHLGGALFGFIFIRQMKNGRDLSLGVNWLIDRFVTLFQPKPPMKVSYRTKEKPAKKAAHKAPAAASKQERLDAILDKIAQSGYESLSKEEKEFLFKISQEE